MGLNIAKGQMYDWITHTWNTVKGECPHDCSYCYMKRFGKLSPVHFDKSELKTDLGYNNYIFIGSSCDMFADSIPEEWISQTIYTAGLFQNKYLLQTKNPERVYSFIKGYKRFDVCVTLESNRHYSEMAKSPLPIDRLRSMLYLSRMGIRTFVTVEPIMDFDVYEFAEWINILRPYQVNIGADSGNNKLPEPSRNKILEFISYIEYYTIVKEKSNLKRLLKC